MIIKKIFTLVLFLILTVSLNAQFTYIGGGLGVNSITYNRSGAMSSSNTSYSNLTLRISGTQRFTRYFGLGMDLAFPVAQKTKFSFTKAQTFNSTSQFSEFGPSTPLRYKPQEYKYAFKESPRISIFGRFFFETFINSYLDVRFSIFKINESFILKRASTLGNNDYPSVVEININYSKDHLQFIPGFTVGIKPTIWKNLFLDINAGLNFYLFKDDKFKYLAAYDWDILKNVEKYVVFESQTSPMRSSFSLNLGFGFYF